MILTRFFTATHYSVVSASFAISLFVVPGTIAAKGPTIDTFAGSGEKGFAGDGGNAVEAALDNPFGVIVGADGDILFCDTKNHVIRRISAKNGTIETIVGSGNKGYSGDGKGPREVTMNEPYELRLHPSGDLYWVEMMNHVVRRLDARRNVVETVAGTGEKGFGGDGGKAVGARMNRPHSIVFDGEGRYLFICDIGNHRIRRVNLAKGTIETWCGTGEPKTTSDGSRVSPETPLKGPRALDRAPDGDLWLALREGNQVFRIDVGKETLHHIAGTGKKGFHSEDRLALESELSGPKGVAISPDGSQVYLADTESHTVRVIDLKNDPPILRLVAGNGTRGDGPDSPDPLQCRMDRLHGVGTDPIDGTLYIGDSETHKVRRVAGLPGAVEEPKRLADYETVEWEVGGRSARLVCPAGSAPGEPWIWRCRFFGAFPSVDEALLAAGWHVAWIDVKNEFGGPRAMEAFDQFYEELVGKAGLSEKPVMEGFSRGGLPALNWTLQNPTLVSGVYLDAPVLDLHSWPGDSREELWLKSLAAYDMTSKNADKWEGPLGRLAPIAKHRIPVFLVAGGDDEVVPWSENGGLLEVALREANSPIEVIVKAAAGHHPHSLRDPRPVVNWAKSLAASPGS
ncbi:MAG: hypothetical protein AAGC68_14405 [Verrucomicrobiota bacterium]